MTGNRHHAAAFLGLVVVFFSSHDCAICIHMNGRLLAGGVLTFEFVDFLAILLDKFCLTNGPAQKFLSGIARRWVALILRLDVS